MRTRLMVAAIVAGGAALAAVPALGAPDAAAPVPAATCPASAGPGPGVAGSTLSALATGFRYQVNSPGLLPVGDATEGNVTEADVPFARMTVSQGPLVDALAAPAYPGDTAAHLGTAVATFGGPATPNDPALAEASFPPSPGHSGDESFVGGPSGGGVAAGAGSAHSVAAATGGSASSVAASAVLTQPGVPAISAGASTARTTVDVGSGCVDATAQSSTAALDIGGVIKIAGVSGVAAARSDGRTGTPHATLTIGRVTVAGLDAFVDRSGVHLKAQQPVGAGVVDQVQSLLGRTLSAAKISIHVVDPTTTVHGASAVASSGGLAITGDRELPATGVPGLPALSIPGVPPVPLGTPPLPLHTEVVYGAARVGAAATSAPPSTESAGAQAFGVPDVGPAPPAAGPPSAPDAAGSQDVSAPSADVVAPAVTAGPGATVLRAGPVAALPRGAPVPLAGIIIGILLSAAGAGPLLGYARWQLLDGRSQS
ncbi:MAG: hypothetical protein NVSMB12_06670 [Acidimicrobiales bacterium]